MSYRELSNEKIEFDYIFILEIKRIMHCLCISILDILGNENWKQYHNKLSEELLAYVHFPAWFFSNKESIKRNDLLIELSDSISNVALKAIQLDRYDVITNSIKAISWYVELIFSKATNKNGFDELRVMLRICYLGILALKLNQKFILNIIKDKIKWFEDEYASHYQDKLENLAKFELKKSRLQIEVEELNRTLSNHGILFVAEHAVHHLLTQIESDDIQKFIFEIWNPLNHQESL